MANFQMEWNEASFNEMKYGVSNLRNRIFQK